MDSVTYDFTRFLRESEESKGRNSKLDEIAKLSMIAIKLSTSTISSIRKITTEGMPSEDRASFVRKISDSVGSDVFELSTCNRVLYVGFGVTPDDLQDAVLSVCELNSAPFQKYRGMEVWRHLVKVCSGLDSFIIGELQVMGQFRGAVSWHRKNGLLSDINASFFDHVVAANRAVRKELGFTKTTESMFNLAATAIEESMDSDQNSSITVIGYGDMGIKAVEALVDSGHENILVVTRDAKKASDRTPDVSKSVRFARFDEWDESDKPQLIISTIRNTEAMFSGKNPLPVTNQTRILDFSWPPSIDVSGVNENQILLDMKHWIRAAHKMEIDWNYEETIQTGEGIISGIEERFRRVLEEKNQAAFRSFIYARMESISTGWESSGSKDPESTQMTAFSREIATWICNQKGSFHQEELQTKVLGTERNIKPSTLETIITDVTRELIRINSSDRLPGVVA